MDRDPGTQIPLDSNGQLILITKYNKAVLCNLAPHSLRLRAFFATYFSSSGHKRKVVRASASVFPVMHLRVR